MGIKVLPHIVIITADQISLLDVWKHLMYNSYMKIFTSYCKQQKNESVARTAVFSHMDVNVKKKPVLIEIQTSILGLSRLIYVYEVSIKPIKISIF